MTGPTIKGWCPGALRPMESGDGLVVRVRVPLSRLSPDQACALAGLAAAHGNGRIDLTARANLQLRGVRAEDHAALLNGLRELGLLDSDIAQETRRNILMTPFWTPGDDSHRVALRLAEALPQMPTLPGKFGFAVDCGPTPVLSDRAADIRIERGAGGRLICRADGAPGGVAVTPDTAAEAARDLARWFIEHGGVQDGRGRMAPLLTRGIRPKTPVLGLSSAPVPSPGPTSQGWLAGVAFGALDAELLNDLAAFGPLRMTPWRMLLIEGCTRAPDLPGLVTYPADPLRQVHACTGAPGCPQALADSRQIARFLAPDLPKGQSLHVSGCAKGCAHPKPCDLTLVATGPDRFDLIERGHAADRPNLRGIATADLPATLKKGSLDAPQL